MFIVNPNLWTSFITKDGSSKPSGGVNSSIGGNSDSYVKVSDLNNPTFLSNILKSIMEYQQSGTVSPDTVGSLNGTQDSNSAGSLENNNLVNELKSYLEGFMTNQGKENQLNREYNSAEALLNRDFQAQQAQLQRDWYEEMSNTAYQRSVADLKKAGLNPALAYSQGGSASSGTGIPAGSAAAYTATGGDTISSILSSVADVISSVSGASASKVSSAFKIFKFFL